jgi:hypothetical protein
VPALFVALLVAGCTPPSYTVYILNDTNSVVTARTVAVQSQRRFSLPPNQMSTEQVSSDTIGLRLSTASGAALGCLRPTRYGSGGLTFFGVPDRVSQAHGDCPGEGWFDFLHTVKMSIWRFALLPVLLGALGAAIWLFIWARGRPRRTRAIAAIESVGLCGLSAAIGLLLVRWSGP